MVDTMDEIETRDDLPEEEARKSYKVIFHGEGLLNRAQEVAKEAKARHRDVTGDILPADDPDEFW